MPNCAPRLAFIDYDVHYGGEPLESAPSEIVAPRPEFEWLSPCGGEPIARGGRGQLLR